MHLNNNTGRAACHSSFYSCTHLCLPRMDLHAHTVYAFDGSAVVTSRIYPLPYVEHEQAEDALKRAEEGQQPKSSHRGSQASSAPGLKPVGTIGLGAWGYQVAAKWGPGHVKVKAEAHEVGSCWVDPSE